MLLCKTKDHESHIESCKFARYRVWSDQNWFPSYFVQTQHTLTISYFLHWMRRERYRQSWYAFVMLFELALITLVQDSWSYACILYGTIPPIPANVLDFWLREVYVPLLIWSLIWAIQNLRSKMTPNLLPDSSWVCFADHLFMKLLLSTCTIFVYQR